MKNWQTFSTRQLNKKLFIALLAAGVVLAVILSICVGTVSVSVSDIVKLLFGKEISPVHRSIILYARVPRTIGCLLAGAALAVSGAVIQTVLSNPLAAPNIIGVNSGAGMAVAIGCAFFPAAVNFIPLMAFFGALAGILLVLFVAERNGASKITLVLAGVAVSSIFGAVIDAVISFVPDALNGYSDFRIGGFSNLPMSRLLPAAWVIVPVLILLTLLSPELDILSLGTDTAKSLGLSARKLQILFLALAAALSGAAVSFAGLLGFVGLIVPHIIRSICGQESRYLIAGSAFGGAFMLTLCDTVARTVFAPYELSVGIILSFIGGPFFIWLLLKQRGGRIHD